MLPVPPLVELPYLVCSIKSSSLMKDIWLCNDPMPSAETTWVTSPRTLRLTLLKLTHVHDVGNRNNPSSSPGDHSLTFLVDWHQAALTWLPCSWFNYSGGCALQTPIRVRALLLYTGISPSHDDSHFSPQSSTAAAICTSCTGRLDNILLKDMRCGKLPRHKMNILFNTSQHPI